VGELAVLPEAHRLPLRQVTADILRRAIFDGRLAQGEQLKESQLASQLGVSRAPIREALRGLTEQGLVVLLPHRGSFVAKITPDDVAEMLTVRERLEPLAIERALAASRPVVLRELEHALGRMRRAAAANDPVAHAEAHVEFHEIFYRAADHRLLLQIWERLKIPQRLYFQVHSRAFATLSAATMDHVRLHAAIRSNAKRRIKVEVGRHFRTNVAAIVEAARAAELAGTSEKEDVG